MKSGGERIFHALMVLSGLFTVLISLLCPVVLWIAPVLLVCLGFIPLQDGVSVGFLSELRSVCRNE